MNYKTIIFREPEQGIGLLTLNRPEQLNALNMDMLNDLHDFFSYLGEHTEIRVLIITGAGRGFCSGADLKASAGRGPVADLNIGDALINGQKKYSDRILEMRRLPQPIIAAVNGPATGGGMCLTLASDVSIASENAYFIPSFINIGLSGGDVGSSYLLTRAVGEPRAREILMTGRIVSADEAERIGMVSRKVSAGELMPAAMETARQMIAKSRIGLRFTKEVMNQNIDAQSLDIALEMENRNQIICAFMPDFYKAVTAFAQRKKK
jgi:enoyl-CoA hydratase